MSDQTAQLGSTGLSKVPVLARRQILIFVFHFSWPFVSLLLFILPTSSRFEISRTIPRAKHALAGPEHRRQEDHSHDLEDTEPQGNTTLTPSEFPVSPQQASTLQCFMEYEMKFGIQRPRVQQHSMIKAFGRCIVSRLFITSPCIQRSNSVVKENTNDAAPSHIQDISLCPAITSLLPYLYFSRCPSDSDQLS